MHEFNLNRYLIMLFLRCLFLFSVGFFLICACVSCAFSRRALANALAAAPSMWTLGNAGMGALQVDDYNFMQKVLLTSNIASFFLLSKVDSFSFCCRDWQKIATQPLLPRHPKLFMN